jgi:hypothetical protein
MDGNGRIRTSSRSLLAIWWTLRERQTPRFPESKVQEIGQQIAVHLEKLNMLSGVSSAARGATLIEAAVTPVFIAVERCFSQVNAAILYGQHFLIGPP